MEKVTSLNTAREKTVAEKAIPPKVTYRQYGKTQIATTIHKFWVAWYIVKLSANLLYRAIVHDFSKYSKVEAWGFAVRLSDLKGTTYGSPEYFQMIRELPHLRSHYQHNSHHPEFYEVMCSCKKLHILDEVGLRAKSYPDPNCPRCKGSGIVSGWQFMPTVDRLEMLCDWLAAVRRHKDGDIFKSIEINQHRYGYSNADKAWLISLARSLSRRKNTSE